MFTDLLLLAPVAVLAFLLLFLRGRTPADFPATDTPPANAIVVDGSNVMHWGGAPSADVLGRILSELQSKGYAPIVFFDANVGYLLGDRYMNERMMAGMTGIAPEHICVVDKGVVADEMLLAFAADHGLRVVSNDRYRDWRVKYPFIAKKGRTLRGTYRDGTVVWRGKLS